MLSSATDVVVVAAKRTPMGSFLGSLSGVSAPQLAATVIRELLAGIDIAGAIDEVLLGCVLPAGMGQAPARQAALYAGLPELVVATTVNKVCGSGMKTVMLAADMLRAGDASMLIAGGMESMSRAPYMLDKARTGQRMGHGRLVDHMFIDGLEDAYSGTSMGSFAQITADEYGISRQRMDAWALTSLSRAQHAISEQLFADELVPVSVNERGGARLIDTDEQPGLANADKIPLLKPAFSEHGSITAANASSISDGAAALLLMRREQAAQLQLPVLATLRGYSSHGQLPQHYTTAPVAAVTKLLTKLQWPVSSVDLFEINEAFALVTLLTMDALDIPAHKVNVNGGACALGHPIGCSGSRILVTLIHALRRRGLTRGVATLCIGGGEATAVAVEVA